jgi:sporulation protein YlmC with PRC-barrel domain
MAHCGVLGSKSVPEDLHDIRGTIVRRSDGQRLGKVNDVIFDHDTMEIRYLVVDSDGSLEVGTFLLGASGVSRDEKHNSGLVTSASRQQIENAPKYNNKFLRSTDDWNQYEQEFKEYWEEDPVMHMKGSDRIITPPDDAVSAQASSAGRKSDRSDDLEINPANLFPERLSPVFSDPEPSGSKVTLRPKSVARAEEAASGVTLLKPRWWDAFENYLHRKKGDIQSNCPQCSSQPEAQRKVA